jgi:hypothetical protein
MKRLLFLCVVSIVLVTGLAACGKSSGAPVSGFELENLILDVFDPLPGEKILVMIDVPQSTAGGNASAWYSRRQMAERWHDTLEELSSKHGFEVLPMLTYPATGAHSGPLPEMGEMDGKVVRIDDVLGQANIVLALTEYSATAPLIEATERYPDLRVASMPTVSVGMEETALSADYGEVAHKVNILQERLERAEGATVEFSTGQQMFFDLRYRHARADDGRLHADEGGERVINLPSGEAYIVPYEGEIEGDPSRTAGTIPFLCGNDMAILKVEENRVVNVLGEGGCAQGIRDFLAVDDARRNIAELGLGCNDRAVITGNVLEDEKVQGIHWAFGLSEALGGTVGIDDFSDSGNALHWDIVYPTGGAIEASSLVLQYEDGSNEEIIREGEYTVFSDESRDLNMVEVVKNFALAWFFTGALSATIVAWDVERSLGITRAMNIGWAWICMVFGVIGLGVYFLGYRRSLDRETGKSRALSASLYAATGVIAGSMFMMILSVMSPEVDNAGPALTLALMLGLPYLFGLFVFRATFMASRLGGRYGAALVASAFPELLSVLFVLAGVLPAVLLPVSLLPELFGKADPRTLILFSFGAVVGAIVAYPFNLWMVRRGYALWPAYAASSDEGAEVKQPGFGEAWRVLSVGAALFLLSLGVTMLIVA